ncbi:hypothetical protein DP116_09840 [Brasilonema bromeliae SPC951]|uniref:GS catalytic domain-containing protein n=1 Tax=Brasilonema bromeliae SPC951 TaxID=385972 RepID=A0ABX1P6X8_9CYAN|nr:hypothetical protein [Brasilonema bromeliae SPC951]
MAGIVHHLPAMNALTTPNVKYYRCIHPHNWSGAFRCWAKA